jgi:hypothetical protein
MSMGRMEQAALRTCHLKWTLVRQGRDGPHGADDAPRHSLFEASAADLRRRLEAQLLLRRSLRLDSAASALQNLQVTSQSIKKNNAPPLPVTLRRRIAIRLGH